MPRKPRSKSPTGYFHVTLRGNGGQLLFDDAEDRIAMLQILDAILPKHNARGSRIVCGQVQCADGTYRPRVSGAVLGFAH